MKKRLLLKRFACSFCILAGCLMPVSSYASFAKLLDGEEIRLSQKPTTPNGSPHMPAYVPFYAELETDYVLLGSYSNCGIVDVSLTSTAGDDYSTVFDTSDGTIYIPISGYTGDYVLLITTRAGVEYVGEFSI